MDSSKYNTALIGEHQQIIGERRFTIEDLRITSLLELRTQPVYGGTIKSANKRFTE